MKHVINLILDGMTLITDDIDRAYKNTAQVEDECNILFGKGDIVCYQPKIPSIVIIIFHQKLTSLKLTYKHIKVNERAHSISGQSVFIIM